MHPNKTCYTIRRKKCRTDRKKKEREGLVVSCDSDTGKKKKRGDTGNRHSQRRG
jgi:hypothetical protein